MRQFLNRRGTMLPPYRVGMHTVAMGALLIAVGCSTGSAPGPRAKAPEPQPPALSKEQRQANVESFDRIWQIIHDQYFDPQFGGVDWDAVRAELRPKVAAAESMQAARAVMKDAVGRLGQSHFNIIPSGVYEGIAASDAAGETETGLTVRVLGGSAIVTHVTPESSGARAGVRAGWEISHIDGEALGPILKDIAEVYAERTTRQSMLVAAVEARLAGPVSKAAEVRLVNGKGRATTRSVERERPAGKPTRFGHLPPVWVSFKSRRVGEDVGYIAFNLFMEPVTLMPRYREALREFADTKGVVIDLRGNPGGIGALAMGMAGQLMERAGKPLGTMRGREMNLNFVIFPQAETYGGRVAILIDGCSASTAEIFAGGLKDLGRARIFGQRSAGAALPSAIIRLPNNDGFQYAQADYTTSSGRRLEGQGVIPDVEVVPTREALLAGVDPALDAAVEWIRSKD
jgi:carboxyl-terminal processing protease